MEEFKPLKETRTAIIDKTENLFEPLPAEKSEDKKESAKKILFENNSPEALVEFQMKQNALSRTEKTTQPTTSSTKIQFEAAKSFFSEKPKEEIAVEKEIDIQPEIEKENKVYAELEIEIETEDEIVEEFKTEENVDSSDEVQEVKKIKPKTGLKKRLKIITFGFFAVLTCFLGWSIYNAVEIQTLRAQLEASNKTFGINVVNYISNISKADDLTTDSLFNLKQLSEAGVIPVEPSEIEDHVEYTIKSNWFDRFCNWLSGIFK